MPQNGLSKTDATEALLCFAGTRSRTNRNSDCFTETALPPSEQSTEQCIGLVDYNALNSDEISFKAGDVINVTGKGSASGFWEGFVANMVSPSLAKTDVESVENFSSSSHISRASRPTLQSPQPIARGLFPNCLVTSNMGLKYSTPCNAMQNVALCLHPYSASGEGEMSFDFGDVITAVRPSSSPGWWYGIKSSGPRWVAPNRTKVSSLPAAVLARFVDPAAATAASSSHENTTTKTPDNALPQDGAGTAVDHSKEEVRLFPTSFVTCDVVQVSFDFTRRQTHELSCNYGDVIQVHRRWNDGWWEGTLGGLRGIFPSNYTIPNIPTTTPPLFCERCRVIFTSFQTPLTCATCAAEARVECAMMQAMEAYMLGKTTKLDLFAQVDIGRRKSSEAFWAGESHSRGDGAPTSSSPKVNIRDSHNQKQSLLSNRASTCDDRSLSRRPYHQHSDNASSDAHVSLLTENDMAELACNRVKSMT